MDLNNFLAVAGLLATIIFGLPALLAWLQNIPPQVFYGQLNATNLFTINSKNIEDIEVLFRGKKIDANLYLVSAFFLYQGGKDIDGSKAKKPIYVDLPEDSKVYSLNIIRRSKDLEVVTEVSDNRLIFSVDVLKNNDYFLFDTLVELKSDNPKKSIIPGHRIVDVNPIEIIEPYGHDSLKYVSFFVLPLSLIFLTPALFLFYSVFVKNNGALDYNSKDISINYYLEKRQVNIDSLNSIYNYRAAEVDKVVDRVKDLRKLDNVKREEVINFVEELNLYNDVIKKSEYVFYKFIPNDYPLFSLLTKTTTKIYPVNKKFSISFNIDITESLAGYVFSGIVGTILFTVGLILFTKWYGRRRVSKQIDSILRERITST